jgi:hypothetical protein
MSTSSTSGVADTGGAAVRPRLARAAGISCLEEAPAGVAEASSSSDNPPTAELLAEEATNRESTSRDAANDAAAV